MYMRTIRFSLMKNKISDDETPGEQYFEDSIDDRG